MEHITTLEIEKQILNLEIQLCNLRNSISGGVIQDGVSVGHIITKFAVISSLSKDISKELIKVNELRKA